MKAKSPKPKPKSPKARLPKSEKQRLAKLTLPERNARARGFRCIAGVDEAGRGPLAGPVVAAACIIREQLLFPGINDSKLLSPSRRQVLFQELTHHPDVHYAVGVVDSKTIDQINILQATIRAMRFAVARLQEPPDYLLIDGMNIDFDTIESEGIIQGDRKSQSIAAASVIAKEIRDALMREFHERYPQYGFDRHKGYGTAAHRTALAEHGLCPIHRRSFAPCAVD